MNPLVACLVVGLALPGMEEGKADAATPPVSLSLGNGKGNATPARLGTGRTGGGNIHVTQPAPDTISILMTGAAWAKAHPTKKSEAEFTFELAQNFEVVRHSPGVKNIKLIMWGRTIGLLRSEPFCKTAGMAGISLAGKAAVSCGPSQLICLEQPTRAVADGQSLSVHDREGPVWTAIAPGTYLLHQTFGIAASHGKGFFGRGASAEFAPDPALEEDLLGNKEPFHGAEKKDFGFQIILKVVGEEEPEEKKPEEKKPEEKK